MLTITQFGDPRLNQASEPVTVFDEELATFAKQLQQRMELAKGVGISASQVSRMQAMFIVASHPNERYPHAPEMEPLVVINPKVEAVSDSKEIAEEGCLSLTRRRLKIERHSWIEASFQDLQGNWHRQRFEGFIARIFQHELDHMNGITLFKRIKLTEAEKG